MYVASTQRQRRRAKAAEPPLRLRAVLLPLLITIIMLLVIILAIIMAVCSLNMVPVYTERSWRGMKGTISWRLPMSSLMRPTENFCSD